MTDYDFQSSVGGGEWGRGGPMGGANGPRAWQESGAR